MNRLLSVKTIVATAIGAALFFVLGRFVAIPSPVPNTNISVQYGVLAFIAGVFGPIAGVLAGLIGHFFIDFSYGWGVWWSWVIASGFFGLIMGVISFFLKLDEGEFNIKGVVLFNVSQAVSHIIAWIVIAPTLDILIYAEPANKVFLQGVTGAIINIITTAIVGTLLCIAYSTAIPKKGSLKEED
ncbi:ECF-type riboflavin transporter substrate-binding protein [Butyrivibrio fibrisolvens]|jgi:energy-coupling factor transport system substrate-specific component|uniref:ECF-type riboflavin transporter substrate-binding protein n=1 Tax=Butyrivibrio fibrisolvens TaxID=831 RepID=UPI0003B3A538|nr:ECF-type riboflavin transporter substrate-binding protein [Butyrivibrio fibrisolvens]